MRAQQRAARVAFHGATNSEMVFASICLPGCRDIADLRATIRKGEQDLSNRIKAAGLDEIKAKGFHEVDAVSEEQFWLVPPERKAFLSEIGAIGIGQQRQTWLPGIHIIIRRGHHEVADIRAALTAQWPILGQVDVRAFKNGRTLEQNLDRITSYCTKFSSLTALRTDTRTAYLDGWPISWDIELHSYLNSLSERTAFEFMRFSKGFNKPRVKRASDSLEEVEPLPLAFSFTEIPMHIYTGCSRASL